MLTFAQWVLKGRLQAIIALVICIASSPWLSINALIGGATLSLIWLRKGPQEGVAMLFWAVLPAGCIAYFFNSYTPLLMILMTSVISAILRKTANWQITLITLSGLCLLLGVGLEQLVAEQLQNYAELYHQLITQLQQNNQQQNVSNLLPKTIETLFIAGFIATMVMIGSFISLLVARSYQARLFNPGGFQQEFHGIRINAIVVMLGLITAALMYQNQSALASWIWIPLFPVFIAGIAFFHYFALNKKLATQWYFIFYIVLIFWNILKLALVFLGALDSLLNLRQRVNTSSSE